MVRVRRMLGERGWWGKEVKMVLSIHDELLFEIADSIMREAIVPIQRAMESVYALAVPLTVSVSSGKDWGHIVPVSPGESPSLPP